MSIPTVQFIAKRLLRYIGVNTLDGTSAPEALQPGDLDDAATAINGAMQELWDMAPTETKERDFGYVLRPPTDVTVRVIQFSSIVVISNFAPWMLGCSIRISGDDQDNEINSSSSLAVPYMGNTGTVPATVFADCVQIECDIESIYEPVMIPNQFPLVACKTKNEFDRYRGAPSITTLTPAGAGFSPFFAFYRRTIARPLAWYVEGYSDPYKPYVPKRIRIGPMPNSQYPLSFRGAINAPRITAADITAGTMTLPVINGWGESVLLPVALQRFTVVPAFKNEDTKKEIGRQYQKAMSIMENSRTAKRVEEVRYI